MCRGCCFKLYLPSFSIAKSILNLIYEKRKGQVPLGPLMEKENIQAEEVYWHMPKGAPSIN